MNNVIETKHRLTPKSLLVVAKDAVKQVFGFARRNWAFMLLGAAFFAACMIGFGPNMTFAADDGTKKISASLTKSETPIVNLFKAVGKFGLLISILGGIASQYLGQRFAERGKAFLIGGVIASAVIMNAIALRDFVWGIF
ncbi:hypothetical protein [Lacticaseibacillus sharpeae]|jgi:hypothetical protein|uniref:hypothetical protein n=1 Tax=Lacticaseibacillus sharpeae TaxID=1626 RepID=UPI0006D0598A|nr:hypothetical protein [Lacticaseibacillus sharpeae]